MTTRLAAALAAFEAANAEDPNTLQVDGRARPRELVHAERLAAWVERLDPDCSEALRLASHCQHIRRWQIPRSSFAEGRVGYLQWRKQLGRFHADEARKVLRSVGYDEELIEAVRRINMKQGLHSDPDTRTMEDALCLAFMQHELPEFAEKHETPKLVNILQKTWAKMSPRGREVALTLQLPPRVRELVEQALASSAPP